MGRPPLGLNRANEGDHAAENAGWVRAAITLLHVTETKAAEEAEESLFKRLLEDNDYGKLETRVEAGTGKAGTIRPKHCLSCPQKRASSEHRRVVSGELESHPCGGTQV